MDTKTQEEKNLTPLNLENRIMALEFTGLCNDAQEIIAGYLRYNWILKKILTGHRYNIEDLVFSPTNILASRAGKKNKILMLWDINTGKCCQIINCPYILSGQLNKNNINFSKDCKYLAIFGSKNGIFGSIEMLWNIQNKNWEYIGKEEGFKEGLIFSPQNELLSYQGSLITRVKNQDYRIVSEFDIIKNLTFSQNGQYIAIAGPTSVSSKIKIILLLYPSFKILYSFSDADINREIAFSPDNKFLIFFVLEGIKIIDINTGACTQTLKTSPDSTTFLNNSNYLAIKDFENLDIWNIETGEKISNFQITPDIPYSPPDDFNWKNWSEQYEKRNNQLRNCHVTLSNDGQYLATSIGNKIHLWRNQEEEILNPLPQKISVIRRISKNKLNVNVMKILGSILPDKAIQGTIAEYLNDYDIYAKYPRSKFKSNLVMSCTGKYIATFDNKTKTVKLWSILDNAYIQSFNEREIIGKVVFSFDDKYIAIHIEPYVVKIYNIKSKVRIKIIAGHNLKFSTSSDTIYYNYFNWMIIEKLKSDDIIDSKKLPFDFKDFVLASNQYLVILTDNNEIIINPDHNGLTNTKSFFIDFEVKNNYSFSADGKYLGTVVNYGNNFNIIKIWRIEDGKHFSTYCIPNSSVPKINFLEKGNIKIYFKNNLFEIDDMNDKPLFKFRCQELGGNSNCYNQFSENGTHILTYSDKIDQSQQEESDDDEDLSNSVIIRKNLGKIIMQKLIRESFKEKKSQ